MIIQNTQSIQLKPNVNQSLESLVEQIHNQKTKLKENLIRLHNYAQDQTEQIQTTHPQYVEGVIQNFRPANLSEFPGHQFKWGNQKLRQYFQFNLTSKDGKKYLILICDNLFSEENQTDPKGKVLLYLPASFFKEEPQEIDGCRLVVIKPPQKPVKAKKNTKKQDSEVEEDEDNDDDNDDSDGNKDENGKGDEKEDNYGQQVVDENELKKEVNNQDEMNVQEEKENDSLVAEENQKVPKIKKIAKQKNHTKSKKQKKDDNRNTPNERGKSSNRGRRGRPRKVALEVEQTQQDQENCSPSLQTPTPAPDRPVHVRAPRTSPRAQAPFINVLSQPYLIFYPEVKVNHSSLFAFPDCKRARALKKYLKNEYEQRQDLLFDRVCKKYFHHVLNNKYKYISLDFYDSRQEIKNIYEEFALEMYMLKKNQKIPATFEYFFSKCEEKLAKIHFWVREHVFLKQPFRIKNKEITIDNPVRYESIYSSRIFSMQGRTDALFYVSVNNNVNWSQSTPYSTYLSLELQPSFNKKIHSPQTNINNMMVQERLVAQGPFFKLLSLRLHLDKCGKKFLKKIDQANNYQQYLAKRNTFVLQQEKLYDEPQMKLPSLFNKKINSEVIAAKEKCSGCFFSAKCETLHVVEQIQSPCSNKYKQKYGLNQIPNPQMLAQPQDQDIITLPEQQLPDIEEIVPSDINGEHKKKIEQLTLSELNYAKWWLNWLHEEEKLRRDELKKLQEFKLNQFRIRPAELQRLLEGCKKWKDRKKETMQPQERDEEDSGLRFIIEKRMETDSQMEEAVKMYVEDKSVRMTIPEIRIDQKFFNIFSTSKMANGTFLIELQITSNIDLDEKDLNKAIKKDKPIDVDVEKFTIQGENTQLLNIINLLLCDNKELKKLIIDGFEPITQLSQPKPENPPKTSQKISSPKETMESEEQSLINQKSEIKIDQDKKEHKMEEEHEFFWDQDDQAENKELDRAYDRIMSDQFCTLISGMPGTGKTELIAKVLGKCNKLGISVLVVSFTNRALDNILERALKKEVISRSQTVREGNRDTMDQDFLEINSKSLGFKTVQEYETYFKDKKFWFTTLNSVASTQLIPEKFDLVIVDEASQCFEPLCLGALMKAKKFSLIGDYKQLSPIVKAPRPLAQGMGRSLFERLCNKPGIRLPTKLDKQYRMNNPILRFCNYLVYDHLLKPATKDTMTKKLSLHQNWQQSCKHEDFARIVDPNNEVIIVDHSPITSCVKDPLIEEDLSHVLEVETAVLLMFEFLEMGIKPQEITIICIYNKTVDTIKRMINKIHQNQLLSKTNVIPKILNTQVLTVDRSQGSDKQVIIFVAEMKQSLDNSLFEEERRLNVAVTRAKMKMIMIGSMSCLRKLSVFGGKFVELLDSTKQVQVSENFANFILKDFNSKLDSSFNTIKEVRDMMNADSN